MAMCSHSKEVLRVAVVQAPLLLGRDLRLATSALHLAHRSSLHLPSLSHLLAGSVLGGIGSGGGGGRGVLDLGCQGATGSGWPGGRLAVASEMLEELGGGGDWGRGRAAGGCRVEDTVLSQLRLLSHLHRLRLDHWEGAREAGGGHHRLQPLSIPGTALLHSHLHQGVDLGQAEELVGGRGVVDLERVERGIKLCESTLRKGLTIYSCTPCSNSM